MIDGHNVEEVCKAFYEAKTTTDRPTAILAKTYKGKGVEGMVIQTLFSHPLLLAYFSCKTGQSYPFRTYAPTFPFSVP